MPYKHDYDKTLTRLLEILRRLYEGETLHVNVLAEEFNTSTRTIQRDFNERLIRFPIQKSGRGWKMQEGFCLTKTTNLQDQLVLDMLEKMSENLGSGFSLRAKHLLSKIKNQDLSPVYARLNIEDISDWMEQIHTLEAAIVEKRIVRFAYCKEEKDFQAEINPLKIANFDGYWYVVGLESHTNVCKKYHLKSMRNLQVQEKTFTHDKALDEKLDNAINIWFSANKEAFEVVLHVDAVVAKYFLRKPLSKSQRILEAREDGSLFIAFRITHEMEILPTIMAFLPHIQVHQPTSLREAIATRLQGYLNNTMSEDDVFLLE